jgi:threonine synthase
MRRFDHSCTTAARKKSVMHYISTRGHPDRKQFCEILLEGLAPDSGLYVPETYPRVDDTTLDRWFGLSYPELSFEILSLYIDDIPPADLKAICEKTTFRPTAAGTRRARSRR